MKAAAVAAVPALAPTAPLPRGDRAAAARFEQAVAGERADDLSLIHISEPTRPY